MKRLYADFNASTPDGRIVLDTAGSRESMSALGEALRSGERVLLSDGEMEVEAVVEVQTMAAVPGYSPERRGWTAVPDEATWREATAGASELAARLVEPVWEPLVETRLTA